MRRAICQAFPRAHARGYIALYRLLLPPDFLLDYFFLTLAPLAQLAEHLTLNQRVQGSSP